MALKREVAMNRSEYLKLKEKIKLDTGAELHLSSQFIDNANELIESGYDSEKNMKYLKIYFNEEV